MIIYRMLEPMPAVFCLHRLLIKVISNLYCGRAYIPLKPWSSATFVLSLGLALSVFWGWTPGAQDFASTGCIYSCSASYSLELCWGARPLSCHWGQGWELANSTQTKYLFKLPEYIPLLMFMPYNREEGCREVLWATQDWLWGSQVTRSPELRKEGRCEAEISGASARNLGWDRSARSCCWDSRPQ